MPCSDCVFWQSPDSTTGECRKAMPTVFLNESGSASTFWPICNEGAWCGDWSNDPDKAEGRVPR